VPKKKALPNAARSRSGLRSPGGRGVPEVLELSEDDVHGLGLTAEEMASSPDMGAWGQEGPVPDGARFVEVLRSFRPSYRW